MGTRHLTGPALARLLGDWRPSAPGAPTYVALAHAVRALVLDGRVPLGARLPGERELASALGLSRTTVQSAYAWLRDGGFVASRQGSGSVTTVPADRAPQAPGWGPPGGREGGGPGAALDLAHASPTAPVGALRAALDEALAALPHHLPGHGYEFLGLDTLRRAVADRYTARGLPTTPEEVLVTGGAVHALALVLRLLVSPGDRVLVEHPTYPNALDAIRGSGARAVPAGFAGGTDDTAGGLTPYAWDREGLEAALRQAAPRLAYLVPDFGNPTGHLAGQEDRAAVAAAAARARTTLVVDETLADLALDGTVVPPPMAASAPAGASVVTVGSASKSFWGGLRVGWVRADAETVRRLAALRATLDMGTPVVEQLAVASLLRDAESVLVPRREALAQRRDLLRAALATHLPAWRTTDPSGGLVLWCRLDRPGATALASAAEGHGLQLAAGPRFGLDGAFASYLRLPFTLEEERLAEAVPRLAAAWASVAERPPSPDAPWVA